MDRVTLTVAEWRRFEAKIVYEPMSGCWLWLGATNPEGYGILSLTRVFHLRGNRNPLRAHRIVYQHLVGPIGDGLEIDHLCYQRCCVNPDHLEAVTQQTNVARAQARAKRLRRRCRKGHTLSDQTIYVTPRGIRKCRLCRYASFKKYQSTYAARKRAARKEKHHGSP